MVRRLAETPLLPTGISPETYRIKFRLFKAHVSLRIAERHAGGDSDDLSVVGYLALSYALSFDGCRLRHSDGHLHP
jgi:hypothetical protein